MLEIPIDALKTPWLAGTSCVPHRYRNMAAHSTHTQPSRGIGAKRKKGGSKSNVSVLVTRPKGAVGLVVPGTWHCDESSDSANVSTNEVACYRTERALMVCQGFRYGLRGSPSASPS